MAKGRPRQRKPTFTAGVAPKPPAGMAAADAVVWEICAKDLASRGVLAEVDTTTLERFVDLNAIVRNALAEVRRDGATISTDQGLRKHPAWVIAGEAQRLLLAIGRELGLSPSARKAINAPTIKVNEKHEILDRSL